MTQEKECELTFEGQIWFNRSKADMAMKFHDSQLNSGVGINVRGHKDLFNPSYETVRLIFDDGTEGEARVKKDSWDSCTHLISVSIGAWARRNGLWERKLRESSVAVWLEKVNDTIFRVNMAS